MTAKLTIGPLLFHWKPEERRDFYYKIADEANVDTVYLGEVICSKRTPFFMPYIEDVKNRLEKAGKKVVFSSLSEVTVNNDIKDIKNTCNIKTNEIEANDASALWYLEGKPHRIGQLLNVYNEETLEFLHKKGANHFCLPIELPLKSIKVMGQKATELGASLEVQVFGRMPLALSARCYHARAFGRVKVNCQFVCEEDKDGMTLENVNGDKFFAINGIQTLSYNYLNLIGEIDNLIDAGVKYFRLSPHSNNMLETIDIFNSVINKNITAEEAQQKLLKTGIKAPTSSGFLYDEPACQNIKLQNIS